MLVKKSVVAAMVGVTLCLSGAARANDAMAYESDETVFESRKLNGPRLGMTYVIQSDKFNRDGSVQEAYKEKEIGTFMSQFGWHFEWVVAPESGGPAFVTELLPFIGGVEYGLVIPSIATVFGIRMPAGFEFGMGPQLSTVFDRKNPLRPSLVLAAGHSMNFGDVSIPVNLALLTSKGGNIISMVFGYAMPERRSSR